MKLMHATIQPHDPARPLKHVSWQTRSVTPAKMHPAVLMHMQAYTCRRVDTPGDSHRLWIAEHVGKLCSNLRRSSVPAGSGVPAGAAMSYATSSPWTKQELHLCSRCGWL